MVRPAFFEIKGVNFAFFADFRRAFDLIPSFGPFSVFLIVLVGGDGRGLDGSGFLGVFCILAFGSALIFSGTFLWGSLLLGSRQFVPPGLQDAVFKGIIIAVDLIVDLIHYHSSPAVKVVPYHLFIRGIVFIF